MIVRYTRAREIEIDIEIEIEIVVYQSRYCLVGYKLPGTNTRSDV